ncbi:type I glutamate--ammonia ligase [Magnetofaba australis]|uniref:Glutamine synthetase n=1 Tax=Magnetofaba australis IT-1 TaxID=1434232 RepID=A0A1Y2K8N5_9PROT|nr:type I glutamate--ammonia ligase [Magnetofaba australis]OSM05036.1 putative L-glutamine synthetase [Magnetofaba australis IT-1]
MANQEAVNKALSMIETEGVKFCDFRFTDFKGKWQHITTPARMVTPDVFDDGFGFDGSSIEGWCAINQSDMVYLPLAETAVMDPFAEHATLIFICDIVDPFTGEGYIRDPRAVAKRAEAYLKSTGIGDTCYVGPEAEFFVFDSARFASDMNHVFYHIDSEEGVWNNSKEFEDGNWGHRPGVKGGYFPVPPVDSYQDLRNEMTLVMEEMGLTIEFHHHEVATAGQCEIDMRFDTLTHMADNLQIYKYVVHNVAHNYGKTATFMPKPLAGDNGSGMHCHMSIWKDGQPLFAGNQYADLSEMALNYIAGIKKHARAINAFTNASTNSYKRLIPGFEAPVLLAHSSRNRSASIRIPAANNPKGKRCEIRFPDPSANPYLAFSALMMAGMDGIESKLDAGAPMDKNLYDLPAEELHGIPTVCGSLREALEALSEDREFLKKGDVFSDDLIDAYIDLKMEEVHTMEHTPHPVEFEMYYSV